MNREFKKTIIMVTHDPKAAGRARRVVHLEKGVLKEDIRMKASFSHEDTKASRMVKG